MIVGLAGEDRDEFAKKLAELLGEVPAPELRVVGAHLIDACAVKPGRRLEILRETARRIAGVEAEGD